MSSTYTIIDYLSGLTTYVLDESILKRIAFDRNVIDLDPSYLSQEQRDLLYADILYVIYTSPNAIASIQNQHGQFSQSIGQQVVENRETLYNIMKGIYEKWGDAKLDSVPASSLNWINEV